MFTYILPPPPATLSRAGFSGTNLTLVWAGGTNQSCVLLAATNLMQPRATWTPVATNLASSGGGLTNTISFGPGEPQRYYLLAIPYN